MYGFIELFDSDTNNKIGTLSQGDSVGEEAFSEPPIQEEVPVRLECAMASSEVFLFELESFNYNILKTKLRQNDLEMDIFTLNNYFKRQSVNKRSWKVHSAKHSGIASKKQIQLF